MKKKTNSGAQLLSPRLMVWMPHSAHNWPCARCRQGCRSAVRAHAPARSAPWSPGSGPLPCRARPGQYRRSGPRGSSPGAAPNRAACLAVRDFSAWRRGMRSPVHTVIQPIRHIVPLGDAMKALRHRHRNGACVQSGDADDVETHQAEGLRTHPAGASKRARLRPILPSSEPHHEARVSQRAPVDGPPAQRARLVCAATVSATWWVYRAP